MRVVMRVVISIGILVIAACLIVAVFGHRWGQQMRVNMVWTQPQGVVSIMVTTGMVTFEVPDPDGLGWASDTGGTDTESMQLSFTETTGKEATIHTIMWYLYDSNGVQKATGTINVMGVITPGDAYPRVTMSETLANTLDAADGSVNQSATGHLRFSVDGYDHEHGSNVDVLEEFTSVTVTSP